MRSCPPPRKTFGRGGRNPWFKRWEGNVPRCGAGGTPRRCWGGSTTRRRGWGRPTASSLPPAPRPLEERGRHPSSVIRHHHLRTAMGCHPIGMPIKQRARRMCPPTPSLPPLTCDSPNHPPLPGACAIKENERKNGRSVTCRLGAGGGACAKRGI